jgi:hypothetical protein
LLRGDWGKREEFTGNREQSEGMGEDKETGKESIRPAP